VTTRCQFATPVRKQLGGTGYFELAHLAEEGWNDTADAMDAMERECERMIQAVGDADLAAITA